MIFKFFILETKSFLSNCLIIFPSCEISIPIFHTKKSMILFRVSGLVLRFNTFEQRGFPHCFCENPFGLNFSMESRKKPLACQAHVRCPIERPIVIQLTRKLH